MTDTKLISAYQAIALRFHSANKIPVEKAVVPAAEWLAYVKEMEGLLADAARWRFVRKQRMPNALAWVYVFGVDGGYIHEGTRFAGDALDIAVDEAMRK